jgi:hypothetical protein
MSLRTLTRTATVALGGFLVGCASVPSLPPGMDLQRAVVVPLGSEPDVQLEEAGWKSRSAQTGGMVGMGVGLGLGGAACLGAGPLAPLCLITVVPLTTAVGTVGGAAVGVVHSRNAQGVDDKRALLQREWLALASRAPLPEALQCQLPMPARIEPAPAAASEASPAAWRLQVGYATLGTVGSGVDQPFLLQATARLAVWRPKDQRAAMERTYVAQSVDRLTSAQWNADDALALRRTLDGLAVTLTKQIADDLAQAPH